MGAFYIADGYPKLVRLPLRLCPSHIGHSLAQELDHKWPSAFDAVRINRKNERSLGLDAECSFEPGQKLGTFLDAHLPNVRQFPLDRRKFLNTFDTHHAPVRLP